MVSAKNVSASVRQTCYKLHDVHRLSLLVEPKNVASHDVACAGLDSSERGKATSRGPASRGLVMIFAVSLESPSADGRGLSRKLGPPKNASDLSADVP